MASTQDSEAPSSSASLSPTNAVYGDSEPADANFLEVRVPASPSLSTMTMAAVSETEQDDTITALEELDLGASASHNVSAAPSVTNADDGLSSENEGSGGEDWATDQLAATESSSGANLLEKYVQDEQSNDEPVSADPTDIENENDKDKDTPPPGPINISQPSPSIDPSLITTVTRLLTVPASFFNPADATFTLPLTWAINIIGAQDFEYSALDNRQVLRLDSKLRIQGVEAGLSVEMWKWLVGIPATEMQEFEAGVFESVDLGL